MNQAVRRLLAQLEELLTLALVVEERFRHSLGAEENSYFEKSPVQVLKEGFLPLVVEFPRRVAGMFQNKLVEAPHILTQEPLCVLNHLQVVVVHLDSSLH